MNISRILFIISTLSFLSLAATKDLYLNTTAASLSCLINNPCYLLDPSIYIDSQIPVDEDNIELLQENPSVIIYLSFNGTFNISLLHAFGFINLSLSSGCVLEVGDLQLGGNAIIDIKNSAQIISRSSSVLTGGANINILIGGAFAQDGASFYLEVGAILNIAGYMGFHADVSHIYGKINFIAPASMLVSTGGPLSFYEQTIIFNFAPIIYSAYFEKSVITFNNGWRNANNFATLVSSTVTIYGSVSVVGTFNNFAVDQNSALFLRKFPTTCTLVAPTINGSLYISSSKVVVTNTEILGLPVLILAGASSLTATNLFLQDVNFINGDSDETSNAQITTSSLQIIGDFTAPNISIFTNSAYFRGKISINGELTINDEAYIEESTFTVTGPVFVGALENANSSHLSLRDVVFSATRLRIATNGLFEVESSSVNGEIELHVNSSMDHHLSLFTGSFFNNGYIKVRSPLPLGNYTQGHHGWLAIDDLDLANRSSGYLSISGYAHLNGTLTYNISKGPENDHKMQLPIIETEKGISGTFLTDPINIGDINHHANILYSNNDVFLLFGKKSSNDKTASLWWIWFIVVGAIIAVGVVIFFILRERKRNAYTPVE